MQLRTFLAKNMKDALTRVRADMGPNAVIIASQKAKTGGVMVRAALDEVDVKPFVEETKPAETASVSDFESHYREGLLRRLRSGPVASPNRPVFDRTELLAALHRHRTPDALAHALAEDADK